MYASEFRHTAHIGNVGTLIRGPRLRRRTEAVVSDVYEEIGLDREGYDEQLKITHELGLFMLLCKASWKKLLQ